MFGLSAAKESLGKKLPAKTKIKKTGKLVLNIFIIDLFS
jgi:hypothetical protein